MQNQPRVLQPSLHRPRRPHGGIKAATTCLLVCWGWVGEARAQDVRQHLEALVNPQSGVSCPSPALYSPLRPDGAGVPTVVALAMMFQDIPKFNDVEQTMTADVYVIVRWHDPRLADSGRGNGSADCPEPGDALWTPLIEAENLRSRQTFYSPRFLVDANGTITMARRLLVEVANTLDLRDFPFDRHQFRITLWPVISRADEVVFHPLSQWLSINREQSLMGWTVGEPAASASEGARLGRVGQYARYDVVIPMTRDWGYFAWKLGVPLFLIVLMAYTVYFIPPTGIAQQVALGMTSMLTLIAYMLALGSSLPRISYLTRADRLFVGCAVLVFLGLVKAVLTTRWVAQDAKETIQRVDRLGRLLYPAAFLVILLAAFAL